jgi:2-dehydro-3-deoxyglucarate aldolase/4-hydroxy-2-oxoheptanedioate aldolase
MDRLTSIKEKIQAGKLVLGTHIKTAECTVAELFGLAGFDFVWIDGEHAPLDKQSIQNHIIAAHAGGAAAFCRVAWNDPVLAKPILELGPDGIVFPMIKTGEEARRAVAACTYPPKGTRGYGPSRAIHYGLMPTDKYLEEVEGSFWKIMQIEDVKAVENLDEILSVEGVDAIVVGMSDLSGSLGVLQQITHPEVLRLLDVIAEKTRKSGKPLGISMGFNMDMVKAWRRRGASWMAVGGDYQFLASGAQGVLEACRGI